MVECNGALGSLTSFPILGKSLRAGLVQVLIVVGDGEYLTSIIVEGGGKYPVGGVVGNQITNPFDMVG